MTLPDDAGYSRPDRARAPAWYRIGFDYPDDPARQAQWAVYVPYFYDGGDLWLNGTLLAGVPENTETIYARSFRPRMAVIPVPLLRAGSNELAIRVAAPKGYPLRFPRVAVGREDEIRPLHDRRLFWTRTVPELTVLVSLLVAGFVAFIWWRRRSEVLYGLFGLAAVLWAIRTMTFVIDAMPMAEMAVVARRLPERHGRLRDRDGDLHAALHRHPPAVRWSAGWPPTGWWDRSASRSAAWRRSRSWRATGWAAWWRSAC